MGLVADFYRSTVGKKVAMAASGIVLVLFVIGHMAGNLKIFGGIDGATGRYKIDDYAYFLRSIGAEMLGHSTFLWVVRVVLLGCVVIHAVSGIQLARLNRSAKPSKYAVSSYRSANAASRTMMYGGLFLILFITYHILHFTTGTLHATFEEGKVFSNVYMAFQSPVVMGVYVGAMLCLAAHLYHGTWSMFQTLGIDTPQWNCATRGAAKVVAVILFLGFSAVPVSIYAGVVKPGQTISVAVTR